MSSRPSNGQPPTCDSLRSGCADPAERDSYARLKCALVADGVWGSAYTDAKRAFVEGVVIKARAERGLQGPVDLR